MKQLIFIFLCLVVSSLYAQQNDQCANATLMCGGVVYTSNNIGATAACNDEDGTCGSPSSFCYGVNNTVWFTFTTNQFGGNASVQIGDITSVNGDDTVQVAVISASAPCIPSSYSLIQCSNAVTTGGVLLLSSLLPDTQYWIVVDGKGSTPPAGQCTFEISVNGPAVQNSVTVVEDPPTTCSNPDGTIQVNGPPQSEYSLNGEPSQNNGNFAGLTPGTYEVKVTYKTGCDTTVTVVLPSPSITSVEFDVTPSSCDQPTGTISIHDIVGGTRPYTFTLNSVSQSDSVFTLLAPGTYQIFINDAADPACIFTVHATIDQNKPVTTVVTSNPDCSASNGTIGVSSTGPGPFSYSLSPSAGTFSGSSFVSVPSGTFALITTASNGCQDTILVVLSDKLPISDIQVATTNVNCSGPGFGSANISSVSGGRSPYQYSLNGGAFQSSPSFPSLPAGNYTVAVRDVNGCEYETPFTISSNGTIDCSAGPDKIVYPGVSINLQGTATEGNVFWSPSAGLSDSSLFEPSVRPTKDTEYTMFVITSNGCTCEDKVFVEVAPQIVPVPNAFTPNGDGANDVWRIPNLEFYDECLVDVYTRWGQRVFHSEGYEVGEEWDGKYMGMIVPAGNYYFVIDLQIPIEGAKNLITGTVVIIK